MSDPHIPAEQLANVAQAVKNYMAVTGGSLFRDSYYYALANKALEAAEVPALLAQLAEQREECMALGLDLNTARAELEISQGLLGAARRERDAALAERHRLRDVLDAHNVQCEEGCDLCAAWSEALGEVLDE